jgi:hypothetical protein
MTLRKLVGLAAIGGFLWQHKKRGGQMNMDSFKQTFNGLLDDAKAKAKDFKAKAQQKIDDNRVGSAEDFASASRTGQASDVTGYGSAGYGYGNNEYTKRY